MARIVFDHLEVHLRELAAQYISEMKNAFRSGNNDSQILLACTARLCTLEDIETRLKQKMNQADRIAEKETL